MNKTIIGMFVGTFLLIGGLVWLGQPLATSEESEYEEPISQYVEVVEKYFDFGTISMAKGNVAHIFEVKNGGSEVIIAQKIYTSCMCTSAVLRINSKLYGPFGMPGHGALPVVNAAIAPGEEAEIEVVFDPAAHGPAGVGRIQRSVILENNAGGPVEFNFSAMVTP